MKLDLEDFLVLRDGLFDNSSVIFDSGKINKVVIYQNSTLDNRRDWDELNLWRNGKIEASAIMTTDKIYLACSKYYFEERLTENDKLLLLLQYSFLDNESLMLEHIQRHQGQEWKGLGSRIYDEFEKLLFKKNVKHILLTTAREELTHYWKNKGFMPISHNLASRKYPDLSAGISYLEKSV